MERPGVLWENGPSFWFRVCRKCCAEADGQPLRQGTHALHGQFLHISTPSKAAADQKDASLRNSATKPQTLA